MDTTPDELGARLRRERARADLSLAQLADITGLSKGYLQRLESEPSNPSLQVLKQIADGLDLTIADLLGTPRLRVDPDSLPIPASLQKFIDDEGLGDAERTQLASIRFREGEVPKTTERWRYILNSLNISRSLESQD